MLEYQILDKENYKYVLDIKHRLFPESKSDEDYEKYFRGEIKSNYYLVLKDGQACGTIGWYEVDKDNAFVGWFGVLSNFQGKGYGKEILKCIIREVKSLNYPYLRVYTDEVVNPVSIKLYEKVFDLKERYTYPDKIGLTGNFVVFTKFLSDKKQMWNNQPLNEDENYEL